MKYNYQRTAPTGEIQSFLITDNQGVRYSFTEKEYAYVSGTGNNTSLASNYLLTQIQGNQPNQQVRFVYDILPIYQFSAFNYNDFQTLGDGGVNSLEVGTLFSITQTTSLESKRIKEIIFPNGKVTFEYDTNNRLDVGTKALDKIIIWGLNPQNQYTIIKQFDLIQDYFSGNHLRLAEVQMRGNDNALIGKYLLDYNTDVAVPALTSKARDYWGYYNGADGNTSLLPQQNVFYSLDNGGFGNQTIGTANREPNEYNMKAGILTKINYPTAGFTTFEYEANRYLDQNLDIKIAGGLRIKTIKNYESSTASPIVKNFKYGEAESGAGIGGLNTKNRFSATTKYVWFVDNGTPKDKRVRTFTSNFNTNISPYEGTLVFYPFVTTYEGTDNGKIVHEFKIRTDILEYPNQKFAPSVGNCFINPYPETNSPAVSGKQSIISYHWDRGQLLNKTVFGQDGRKKHRIVNTFANIKEINTPPINLALYQLVDFSGLGGVNEQDCQCFLGEGEYIYKNYQAAWGVSKQIRTEEYTYDDTDDSKFIYKKTETDYDNTFFQPKEVRSFKSDGKINIQKYRYVSDFDVNNSNFESPLYWMRANNQVNTPIEQISLVKLPSETENRFLGGRVTDFLTSAYNGNNYVYPKEIFLFESLSTIFESNYVQSSLYNGILSKDNRYIKRLQLDSYDTYGNLLSYKIVGGSPTAFTYLTTEIDNVFHTFPTSEIKNSGGANAFTTNFSYDIPLLGINEMTAPNGLKSFFEYDNFGRFKRAKDHDGNILNEYEYNFSANNNFVKEFIPRIANTSLLAGYNNKRTLISYSDGLGRPLQTVNYSAGFDAQNDIVTDAKVYDNLGRIEKSYIPFSNVGLGAIAPNPTVVHGDTAPFSNISEYDNSPLNRPKKSFGVGQAWRSANKFIEAKYLLVEPNTIRKYDLTANGANIDGTWNVPLFKFVSISERGKETIEYKDNDGKLIQKDVQDGTNSYMSTHYIYDEFDRVKYVIQPKSFENATHFVENDAYFKGGVFAYKYDKRGRTTESHVPSGGWSYNVFDVLDRSILRQTELQRPTNKWKFAKFDAIGRTLQKGELTQSSSRNDLQNAFDGITNAYEEGNTNQSFPSWLNNLQNREVFIYDNYDFIASEWAFNSATAYHPNYANAKGLLTGVVSWNSADFSKLYHSVLHYDNKNRLIQSYQTHQLGGAEPWKKAIISNFQYNFSGQIVTQNITHQKNNAPNIEDKTENEYDHVGRPLKVFHGINGNRHEVARFTYDEVGRLVQKKIRGDANFVVGGAKDYIQRPLIDGNITQNNTIDLARKAIILEPNLEINAITLNSYLGQIDPNAPQGVPINGLQTIDFAYHIRGMLRGINLDDNSNPTPKPSEGDIFSYKLDYETAGFYDGNIGKQSWKTSNDNASRFYDFNYDDANRLLSASYAGINGEDFSIPNFSYDKSGNILNLQRNGRTAPSGGMGAIDNPTYSYTGNTLNSVTDAISGDHETDFVPRGGNTYTYYNDGSLKSDDNKEITNIIYDTYLDKPTEIQLTNNRWLKMIYNGSGTLLNREFSTNETWDFVSGIIHKNGQYYQMTTPEGRATYSSGAWNYEYFYQDHLGNSRVSFSASGQNLVINDISHFDPTGIPLNGTGIENATENRFKYQNKESLALFGLSGVNDFLARYADKTINRFWGVDALSDLMVFHSPYTITFNNPLSFIDPDGNNSKSTHTDKEGNVLAVFDDGDLGVYVHENNADGGTPTEYMITKRHEKSNSAGGQRVGETWTPLGFADFDKYEESGIVRAAKGAKIDFNSTWASDKVSSILVENPSAGRYAYNARTNEDWDIKSKTTDGNVYFGSLLFGKYASARDAGNFAAGAVAQMSYIDNSILDYGFGVYNQSSNNVRKSFVQMAGDALFYSLPDTHGMAKYQINNTIVNGEDKLSKAGIEAGKKWFFAIFSG